jgi:hypothetical protein
MHKCFEDVILITEMTQTRRMDTILAMNGLTRGVAIDSTVRTEENQENPLCISDPDTLLSDIRHV